MILTITVQGNTKLFAFDADNSSKLVIGRLDTSDGTLPDIDLHEYNAQEKGVSRKHALIIWNNEVLCLADHGSPNGTHLNELRLFPRQPRVLRDGDDIRLGKLVLHVGIDHKSQTEPPEDNDTYPSGQPTSHSETAAPSNTRLFDNRDT